MIVKVVMRRKVPVEKEPQLRPLLMKLRALAIKQPGYISGETLMCADNPEELLVIGSWKSLKDWKAWAMCEERMVIHKQVDELLGEETLYRVYYRL